MTKLPKLKDIRKILRYPSLQNICFNAGEYWELYDIFDKYFDFKLNFKRFDIQRGLYASIKEINIWVSKTIPRGYIRIYPQDKSPRDKNDSSWSIDIKISDFDRMMKLKEFW